jgi:hypothetical protein
MKQAGNKAEGDSLDGMVSTSNWFSPSTSPIRWTWTNLRSSARVTRRPSSPRNFLQALKTGPNGKIAVTYFEWAASSDQKIIIPWRVIDGPETADAVANEIMKTPIRRASRTSISGAINFAMPLFDENPHRGLRRVIDISGDGPNNNGAPVTGARDAALEKGIIINGLPIMVKEPSYSTMDIDNLDFYYEDCVIGGPGSFVVTIKDRDKFKEAIRTKLCSKSPGRTPERRIVPGRREGAAGELHDRRENLAGPLGAVTVLRERGCQFLARYRDQIHFWIYHRLRHWP